MLPSRLSHFLQMDMKLLHQQLQVLSSHFPGQPNENSTSYERIHASYLTSIYSFKLCMLFICHIYFCYSHNNARSIGQVFVVCFVVLCCFVEKISISLEPTWKYAGHIGT